MKDGFCAERKVRELVWRGEEKNCEENYKTRKRYIFSSLSKKKGKSKTKAKQNPTTTQRKRKCVNKQSCKSPLQFTI